jgi:phosphoribosylformimino-5-aminoimidazole carboxamide ribotide isomerase
LGSESFNDETVSELSRFGGKFILSLDYSLAGRVGPETLFSAQKWWPQNIIIMTLARVGSLAGPDLEILAKYRAQYPKHNIIAAGGIRDSQDLMVLNQLGIQQTLVATALHNGKINLHDITNL